MSHKLIADTTSAQAMFWTVLKDGAPRISGHLHWLAAPPDPLDVYTTIRELASTFESCAVNLLPGDSPARNAARATTEKWGYNQALSEAEAAAIAAARLLP